MRASGRGVCARACGRPSRGPCVHARTLSLCFAGISLREGGVEAYTPYRRRVHKLYQLAAHPHFFSCAQRSLLIVSILEAPSSTGGAEIKLATLERTHVISQVSD